MPGACGSVRVFETTKVLSFCDEGHRDGRSQPAAVMQLNQPLSLYYLMQHKEPKPLETRMNYLPHSYTLITSALAFVPSQISTKWWD